MALTGEDEMPVPVPLCPHALTWNRILTYVTKNVSNLAVCQGIFSDKLRHFALTCGTSAHVVHLLSRNALNKVPSQLRQQI